MKERGILMIAPMVRALLAGTKTQTRRVCGGQRELSNEHDFQLDRCPYGQPGDRLWVRETHMDLGACVLYRADSSAEPERAAVAPSQRWTPSIHMPRHLSRITLEITAVRVERLQAISEADAIAEGIHRRLDGLWSGGAWKHLRRPNCFSDPCNAFCDLWASINGPGSWDSNPWVWVIEFRRVEGQR